MGLERLPPAWQSGKSASGGSSNKQRIRQAGWHDALRCERKPPWRGASSLLSPCRRVSAPAPRRPAPPPRGRWEGAGGGGASWSCGPPSTNALILAFVLPLSLFVGTLVTAARVADDLDDRFLREVRTQTKRSDIYLHADPINIICLFVPATTPMQ